MSERSNKLYPKSYGSWAGNPGGQRPDHEYCCVEIYPNERGGAAHRHQCNRKRGHGPDGAYCKQHDPEIVKARKREVAAQQEEAWQKRRLEFGGKAFFDALVMIAAGHNDPRALAQKTIAPFVRDENPSLATGKST